MHSFFTKYRLIYSEPSDFHSDIFLSERHFVGSVRLCKSSVTTRVLLIHPTGMTIISGRVEAA